MREIKFRGKQTAYHRPWIYGSLLMLDGKAYILDDGDTSASIDPSSDPESGTTYVEGLVEVAPDTIGQYTGLKDSEGREIYEGDIISSGATTGIVMYDCEQAGFIVQKEKAIELRFYSLLGIKVIGNIHDNPELLEL